MQMTIPNNKKKKSNFTEIITPSIKETSLLSTTTPSSRNTLTEVFIVQYYKVNKSQDTKPFEEFFKEKYLFKLLL